MSNLSDAFKAVLSGDATLVTLLPGGVFDSNDTPQDQGGADFTPRMTDGVRVKPHTIIRWRSSQEMEPVTVRAESQNVEIYIYQDTGYATIDSAVSRIKTLLHMQLINADDRDLAYTRQTFVSGELPATEIGGGTSKFVRYNVIHVRK